VPETIRFARRVHMKAKPGRGDEVISTIRGFKAALTKEKGMRRVYLLRNLSEPNEFVSVTFWNSKKDADAYDRSGHYSANTGKARELLEADPALSQWDVVYHAVSPSVPSPRRVKKKGAK
jgi:heme-degrading monooxygenase HmoA